MLYFAPLSILSAIPGIIMSIIDHKPLLALIDFVALFIAFFIAFNSWLSITARKILFVVLLYLMAVVLIYYLGSFGPGLLYLLMISVFCILIFSNRLAFVSVCINILICIVFGLIVYFRLVDSPIFRQYTVGSWLAVSINMVVLSLIVAVLLPIIFNGLEQSNNRYEMVARATSDTICDWNLEKDIKQYNTGIYQVFGYSVDEVENSGDWWLDKIHPDDLDRVSSIMESTLKKGGLYFRTDYRFRCADGIYKHILYRSYILRDANKKAVRIISSMQDVTALNNYIEAIEAQNKRLKDISWTQSHVVRAPLTRIMGLVDLLKNIPPENINASEVLEYMITSADELDSVIKDVIKNTETNIKIDDGN